jgi:hypothetical protein
MITFPTTTEAFIAYQEEVTGRKLDKWEAEFSAELTELANLSFDDGKSGRELFNTLDGVEDYFSSIGKSEKLQKPAVQQILRMMDAWNKVAYQAGKKGAQRT